MRMPLFALSPLSVAISLLAASASYAEETTENASTIEPVVVVGETTNTKVKPETLEKYQANDLADVFRHEPSVTVGGSLGIAQKIYIRGLEDTYLNITVDGAPQTTTLFHHIGRVSIEPELLQVVDVQAGAGEATGGAGALGGAIRFKTKNPDDLLDADKQFGGKIKAGLFSNSGHKTSLSLYGNLTDQWSMLGSYVAVDRDNMEDGDGNELYGTAAEQNLGFVKVRGQLTDNQSLTISYEQRHEEGDFGARPNWPTLETDELYPMEGKRKTFVINHQVTGGDALRLQTTAYYTSSEIQQDRFDRWGLYAGYVDTYGFDIRNTSALGSHSITYGADYRIDQASSEYLAEDAVWQAWAWDPAVGEFEEEGSVAGLYVQDHWQLHDKFLLSFGLRYDSYDLEQVTYNDKTDSNDVSPNIGFIYDVATNWRLSMGYAEAMRGKEVGDTFTLEHNPTAISLQPNLQPEQVNNTELGLEYQNGGFLAKASVYKMSIDDVIYDQQGAGAAHQDGTYYENIGEIESTGFELLLSQQWQQVLVTSTFSSNDSEINGEVIEGYEHNGLGNSRGDTFTLDVAYNITDSIDVGWHYTYVADLDDLEVLQRSVELGWIGGTQTIDKPGYNVHDIYLRWLPLENDSLSLDFAVLNLFNEQYRDHSSVGDYNDIPGWEGVAGLNEAGRDVRMTVGYAF